MSDRPYVPFNQPYMTGRELHNIAVAHSRSHLAGDGDFTTACSKWLNDRKNVSASLLTHSCTAALEMSALLLDLEPGDEVIMPSFTFVSTANAFTLRGAVPVFVDVREDTLNLDERLIEQAITPRTKAICVVHYAGVAAEMDEIMAIADRYSLAVVEDAAQGILATYKGRPLGSIGDMGTLSFHETKNIISGEGGALLLRDPDFVQRAEISDVCRASRGPCRSCATALLASHLRCRSVSCRSASNACLSFRSTWFTRNNTASRTSICPSLTEGDAGAASASFGANLHVLA